MAEGDGASSLMRLGPDVLAHVVAALCTMEIDDDDYIEPPPLSILGNLRLCSRALRDVVDAATPCIGVQHVVRDAAPLAMSPAGRRLLSRLGSLQEIYVDRDNMPHERPALAEHSILRFLLMGLPCLPPNGSQRVVKLDLGRMVLTPALATAIAAALPQLQELECMMPNWQDPVVQEVLDHLDAAGEGEDVDRLQPSWLHQTLSPLHHLPTTLRGLCMIVSLADGVLVDGGASLSRLTCLTSLIMPYGRNGVRRSICGHVAGLTQLRNLTLVMPGSGELAAAYADFRDGYGPADALRLSPLVHLTRLHAGRLMPMEHLPLDCFPELQDLGSCTHDVRRCVQALALPSMQRLRVLQLLVAGATARPAVDVAAELLATASVAPYAAGGAYAHVLAAAAEMLIPVVGALLRVPAVHVPPGPPPTAPARQQDASGASGSGTTAVEAAGRGLLPDLQDLVCELDMQWPRLLADVGSLLMRLLSGERLRRIRLDASTCSDSTASAAEAVVLGAVAQLVVYPCLIGQLPWLCRWGTVDDIDIDVRWGSYLQRNCPSPLLLPWDELPLGPGATLAALVMRLPRLRHLDLDLCEWPQDGDTDPPGTQQQQQRVAATDVPGGRAWLTDEALELLASQPGSQLEKLGIKHSRCVTLQGLAPVAELPRLRELDVTTFRRMTQHALRDLRTAVENRAAR